MIKLLLGLLLVVLSWTVSPGSALAHAVQTDYHLVADALKIQSTFDTGEALGGATVAVYAPNRPSQPWLTGVTDQNGTFQFQPDRTLTGEWSVRIGQGDHGDILSVPVSSRGVDVDLISQAPYDAPHRWAKQMVVAGAVLGGSLGSQLLWRRKQGKA